MQTGGGEGQKEELEKVGQRWWRRFERGGREDWSELVEKIGDRW